MKRFFVFAALAAIALSACQQNLDIEKNELGKAVVFTATTESSATKTALSENGDSYDVVWSSGDQITIVDAAAKVGVYSTTGTTTRADFTKESGDDAETAPFKAWYPASVYNAGAPVLPASQTYVEGNISGSPMYAESSTNTLEFKNIVGIIRVNVSTTQGGKSVRRIELSANEGMSGAISNAATLASSGYAATVAGTAGVTLDCGESGVAIGSEATAFHIAVPANTYTSLSITVVTTDGLSQTRTANTGITVSRSQITGVTISFNDLQLPVTDLSAEETANTYIVTSAGQYKFKATVKGNGGLDPLTGTTATTIDPEGIAGVKVLWELYGQGRAIKHYGSAYDIRYNDGYVYFSTPDTFVPGDACVAVYDSEGTILWSWLIWATPEPGTMTHNDATFMDRNLGAIDVGNCMRGFCFQWGRKDAFSAADGNNYSPYTYVPAVSTVFNKVSGSHQSMEYTVKHPTTLIGYTSNSDTWMSEDLTTKPWRPDVKTIYDPCPPGWRIPTKENISGITGLPATGIHHDDSANHDFGNPWTGYYWTASTESGSDDCAWAFCNDGRNLNHWGHTEGYAIRPVRE